MAVQRGQRQRNFGQIDRYCSSMIKRLFLRPGGFFLRNSKCQRSLKVPEGSRRSLKVPDRCLEVPVPEKSLKCAWRSLKDASRSLKGAWRSLKDAWRSLKGAWMSLKDPWKSLKNPKAP